jgi:integrase
MIVLADDKGRSWKNLQLLLLKLRLSAVPVAAFYTETLQAADCARRNAGAERIAPSVIGHRPKRVFVNADGTPKNQSMVAVLITSYARKRAGIILTPHQFRHLGAKIILDANPGAFPTVQHLLGHKSLKSTMIYAGINKRRAARHHYALIELAIAEQTPQRKRKKD